MKPLNSQDQEFVITLGSNPTTPMEVTVGYDLILRTEKENKASINGAGFQKSTSAQEQLVSPPNETTEIAKHIESIDIYNPAGNGTIQVEIDYKDNFPSTPTLCRVGDKTLQADSFMRYSRELGWT